MWSILTSALDTVKGSSLVSSVHTFVDNHRTLATVTACSAGISLYVTWFLKRPKNLPPGPIGYPLVGCLFSFGKDQKNLFKDLTGKYGDIFTFWMGANRYLVILNSYEAIKEVYVNGGSTFMDRDADAMVDVFGVEDTIFNARYNEAYKESRKITIQAIRTLISSKLASILGGELSYMEEYIETHLGQPIDVSQWIKRAFTNTITQILFSKRYSESESDLLTQKLWHWNECSAYAFFSTLLPWYMSLLLRKPRNEGRRITREVTDTIRHIVSQRVPLPEGNKIEDILDAYLQGKNPRMFTEKQIVSTLFSFMPDATFASPSMAMWMLLYLANQPECQDDIYDEVQEVSRDKIDLDLRSKMPVTESFIMEVFRIVTPFSFGVPNQPLKFGILRGYEIPKDVSIMPHIKVVHRDPDLFPEPEIFKPRRFIKDGKIGNTKGFMPFGIGRRMCVGEQLVRNNMFFIVTRLMQKYKIYPEHGVPISTEGEFEEFVKMPKQFSVCFEKR